MLRVMVMVACALALAGCSATAAVAATAAERTAFQKCLAAKSWCVAVVTDRITLEKMPFGMLPAQKPLFVRGESNRVAWHIACDGVRPALFLWSERLLSYGEISIRYRADPGGVIGNVIAAHTGSGQMFMVKDAEQLIDAMMGGKTLTAALALPLNTDFATTTFNVVGLEGVLRQIHCLWR